MVPPSRFHSATKSACSAVPKASLRAPTLTVPPFPNFVSAAPREHLALESVRRVGPEDEPLVLEGADLRCARRRRDQEDVVRDRHRLRHRDRGARGHLADDHVRLVHLDRASSPPRPTPTPASARPPSRRAGPRPAEPGLLQGGVLEDDGLLHGPVEVRAVGGEVAGERQDVTDPQLERAAPRSGRARRGGAGRCGRDRRERGHRHDRDVDGPRELRHALLLGIT